ncbi:MAG: MgtC/SapB family protein [Janthinobacterium lividum]
MPFPLSLLRSDGQHAKQLVELTAAFLLSAAIGCERESRHKSAGLRTYSIVGTTAALFLLVSKYGFDDVLRAGTIVLDPSRVAAQIVTGIGFIGAGLIFVDRNRVKGLTTAATVWLVTGIGMACGAGLLLLALAVTFFYFVIVFVFPYILRVFPDASDPAQQGDAAEKTRQGQGSTSLLRLWLLLGKPLVTP